MAEILIKIKIEGNSNALAFAERTQPYLSKRQWGKYVLDKWSDTLLFNRKSFETDKRENLHTDVLIMSCDKMNTEFHLRPSI